MSIQRVPSVPFTQIANSALRDRRLSFKARGLLALVLSNVGEWNATEKWLTSQTQVEGRSAVQGALKELTDAGYRIVSKESDGKGGIRTVVTWRHLPESSDFTTDENTTVEYSTAVKPGGHIEQHLSEHNLEEHQSDTSVSDQVHLDLCVLLADKIAENGVSKRPKITQRWVNAARLMMDKDGRTEADIRGAIEWSQRHHFWHRNILSMEKLRKHFDRLWLDAQAERSKPDRMQAHLALIEQNAYNEGVQLPGLEGRT